MKMRRFLSFCMCVLFVSSVLITSASAATASVGSSAHQYTYAEPVSFGMNGAVGYSKLYGDEMTITNMYSIIWNDDKVSQYSRIVADGIRDSRVQSAIRGCFLL